MRRPAASELNFDRLLTVSVLMQSQVVLKTYNDAKIKVKNGTRGSGHRNQYVSRTAKPRQTRAEHQARAIVAIASIWNMFKVFFCGTKIFLSAVYEEGR